MQFGCLSLVPQEGEKSYLKNKVIWNNNCCIISHTSGKSQREHQQRCQRGLDPRWMIHPSYLDVQVPGNQQRTRVHWGQEWYFCRLVVVYGAGGSRKSPWALVLQVGSLDDHQDPHPVWCFRLCHVNIICVTKITDNLISCCIVLSERARSE